MNSEFFSEGSIIVQSKEKNAPTYVELLKSTKQLYPWLWENDQENSLQIQDPYQTSKKEYNQMQAVTQTSGKVIFSPNISRERVDSREFEKLELSEIQKSQKPSSSIQNQDYKEEFDQKQDFGIVSQKFEEIQKSNNLQEQDFKQLQLNESKQQVKDSNRLRVDSQVQQNESRSQIHESAQIQQIPQSNIKALKQQNNFQVEQKPKQVYQQCDEGYNEVKPKQDYLQKSKGKWESNKQFGQQDLVEFDKEEQYQQQIKQESIYPKRFRLEQVKQNPNQFPILIMPSRFIPPQQEQFHQYEIEVVDYDQQQQSIQEDNELQQSRVQDLQKSRFKDLQKSGFQESYYQQNISNFKESSQIYAYYDDVQNDKQKFDIQQQQKKQKKRIFDQYIGLGKTKQQHQECQTENEGRIRISSQINKSIQVELEMNKEKIKNSIFQQDKYLDYQSVIRNNEQMLNTSEQQNNKMTRQEQNEIVKQIEMKYGLGIQDRDLQQNIGEQSCKALGNEQKQYAFCMICNNFINVIKINDHLQVCRDIKNRNRINKIGVDQDLEKICYILESSLNQTQVYSDNNLQMKRLCFYGLQLGKRVTGMDNKQIINEILNDLNRIEQCLENINDENNQHLLFIFQKLIITAQQKC